MPFTVTVESYHEFARRHGNRPLGCDGRLLFADGASCSDDGELREEPPRNPVELIRVQLRYWRQAVRRSTADFEALRSQCSRQAEMATRYANLPGPSNGALADLHKLRDAVLFCRTKVAELEKALAEKTANDPDRLRRQDIIRYEREQQAAAAALVGEIASISI